jgi:hypothetical protein
MGEAQSLTGGISVGTEQAIRCGSHRFNEVR